MSCVHESRSNYLSAFEVLARALQPESPSFGPHMRIIGVRTRFLMVSDTDGFHRTCSLQVASGSDGYRTLQYLP